MNRPLLFIVLLGFSTPPLVDSVNLFEGLKNMIFGAPGPAPGKSSLILAVETSGRTYLANNAFVTSQMNKIYSKFLFACPAESGTAQEEINDQSTTKNALFIEKTYEKPKSPRKFEYIEHGCESPVEPSVIHVGSGTYGGDPEIDLFLIGFEVFLDKDIDSYKIDAFNSAQLRDDRFAWFNVYTVAFDSKHGNVVNTFSPKLAYENYHLVKSFSEIEKQVNDSQYRFGEEFFFGDQLTDIKSFYAKKNQETVFVKLFADSDRKSMKYMDPLQDRHLRPVYLVAPDIFGTPFLKLTSETYGNVAAMWNFIAPKTWVNLGIYIAYLAKGLKAIHLVTGTYGTLKLSGKEIYLASNNRIKVPAAFFKIVSYSPSINEKYNMLIVVSNNPYDESDRVNELICKQNQCEEFGWEYIQQDFFAMGRATCCELTKENLRELKMAHMEQLIDKPLNLNRVPHWRVDHLTLDLKSYILNQMRDEELDKPADDEIYKSDRSVIVDKQDDEVTFSNFISIIHTNYVQPYFTEKNYVVSG